MKNTISLVVIMSMSAISCSMGMDSTSPRSIYPDPVEGQRRMRRLYQVWRSENNEIIAFCGISPHVGAETAIYYKEKKAYRARLTRVAFLPKPGRFTFVDIEMVHQQLVFEQLKNRYQANKARELQALQTNID